MLCLNCMNTFDEKYGVCPHCGFIPGTPPKEAYHLYPGTVLKNRYVIGTTVGFGGFGITYRAWDQVLEKKVAIKEFYPNGIVNRVPGEKHVIIYSGNRANEFQNGKVRFLAEARNMARFNTHPNIVNVYEFFEENNTAYIAMEFLEGLSYKQYLAAAGGRVSPQIAVSVVVSVLDALKEIHKVGIIHRDVSPDNIFMVPVEPGSNNFKVKLIDFGAARFSTGEEEKTLSIILKPGYAPPEQYRSKSKQGPWTDIYAVGAVLYRSVTGKMPDESVNRMVEDHLEQPMVLVPEIPQYLNDSIMRAMALNQELRFQNVDQFREAIQNKTKVLSVDSELKRRKMIRGFGIAGICLVLAGAGAGCWSVYSSKQGALYNVEAQISVEIPDVNGVRELEIQEAGALGSDENGAKHMSLVSSEEMMERMLDEYCSRFTRVSVTNEIAGTPEEYKIQLAKDAAAGTLPSVFETGHVTASDEGIWSKLGVLETTYETLDPDAYYFVGTKEFQDYFAAEKKQIPLSFRVPVLYVNTHMIPEDQIPEHVTSLDQLTDENGEISCSVSMENLDMYREAFGDDGKVLKETDGKGYEPFLQRQTAYYLGNTDDYEAVRASLGGIYKMMVMSDLQKSGKIRGQFTYMWSIDGGLEGDAKTAADSMVYYLMGENAQDVFNLQSGNGLSLNKNMMKTYVKNNDEFSDVAKMLDSLTMEYGEK
ncbi:MAG: protein kinase [Brotaphodocola sp.]